MRTYFRVGTCRRPSEALAPTDREKPLEPIYFATQS